LWLRRSQMWSEATDGGLLRKATAVEATDGGLPRKATAVDAFDCASSFKESASAPARGCAARNRVRKVGP